jgi:predicted TIM-barrel fold metal-dependent hydrolase
MSGYSALMRDKDLTYSFFNEFQDNIVYATDIAMSNWIDMPQANLSRFLDEAVESGKISQVVYEKICRRNALRILKEDV